MLDFVVDKDFSNRLDSKNLGPARRMQIPASAFSKARYRPQPSVTVVALASKARRLSAVAAYRAAAQFLFLGQCCGDSVSRLVKDL